MKKSVITLIIILVLALIVFSFKPTILEDIQGKITSISSKSSSLQIINHFLKGNSSYEVQILGSSMSPNYNDNQYCTVDKSFYQNSAPQRNDVILFNTLTDYGKKAQWVKRIIGLPNERIKIAQSAVFINGFKLEETFLSPNTNTSAERSKFIQEGQEMIIPSNQYFVLGDSRERSSDSREYGFIDLSAFVGKIVSCP